MHQKPLVKMVPLMFWCSDMQSTTHNHGFRNGDFSTKFLMEGEKL